MKKLNKILLLNAVGLILMSVPVLAYDEPIKKMEIPYKTDCIDDANLYEGIQQLVQAGANGEKIVIKKDPFLRSPSLFAEALEVISKPVESEIIAIGTNPCPTMVSITRELIFPCNGTVTSTDKSGSHAGYTAIDVANSAGTPLLAPVDGVITAAGSYGGYGNCLQMEAGHYSFLMGHLSDFNCEVGQVVKMGEIIGYMGNTGYSTGSHLHLEIYLDGQKQYIPHVFNLGMGDII